MVNVSRGTAFEIEVASRINIYPDVESLVNVKLYSHFLGKSTQIDNLLLAPWGIYVIEAKSFQTALIGDINQDWWAGVTGRKVTKLFNPIVQNYQHVRTLKNAIWKVTGKFVPMYNYVVLPDSTDIKTNGPRVLNLFSLINMLESDSSGPAIFDVNKTLSIIRRVSYG